MVCHINDIKKVGFLGTLVKIPEMSDAQVSELVKVICEVAIRGGEFPNSI